MAVSVYTGAGGGVASFNGRTGKVVPANGDYTKAQVGLGNVDNTSDANKPISNATQAALNDKQSKITANGILKGDGSGNISAANETEVELVSLPYICHDNLLENWYFGNPVNQRGQTSYTGDGYGIDRWRNDGGSGLIVTIKDDGLTVSGYFGQHLGAELSKRLEGQTVTQSLMMTDGTIHSLTYVVKKGGENPYIHINDESILYFEYPSKSETCSFKAFLHGESIIAAKLELGSQQTLAHQENGAWVLNEIPDYGEQLRRCQRYCVTFNTYDSFSPVDNNDFVVELPGPMRAVQTIINPQNITNANVTNPTVAWYNIGSNQLRLRSTASHGGMHAFCNGLVLFSADL